MKKLIFISLLVVILFSCKKDFIEENITGKTLIINAPADNSSTSSNAVIFWWNEVDGAEKYNVQVVKPNFTTVQQLVADTNVVGTKLLLSLNPGIYQWRIRAFNAGGNTVYQTFNLKVDSTSNLTTQLVIGIAPASGMVTANKTLSFSWNSLAFADKYDIQILNGTTVLIDTTTASTFYTRSIPTSTGGNFSWKVKATNNTSVSQFNTPWTFKIDLVKPGAPYSLTSTPTTNTTTIHLTDTLKWTRYATSTDVSYDSLYVYSDVGLAAIYTATLIPNKKVRIGDLIPTLINNPYWWRVKSVDSVGNSSPFSSTTAFTLTP